MRTACETIRDLFGDKRYPRAAWEAFAYYLEDQRGGVGKAFPQLDLVDLWKAIEQHKLEDEWLHAFSKREDVKIAARSFAAKVRRGWATGHPRLG